MKKIRSPLILAGVLALVATGHAAAAAQRPNIIFILADDYGTGEVGCYGADNYKTPSIDALARGGIRYTHAYTAPLCGPSRALILTGRYAFRTGATNQDATGRFTPSAESMMPSILKPAGYVTAAIGKWGQLPLGPAEFGFDYYLKFSGSGVYWNTQDKGKTYVVNGESRKLGDKEYLPDVMHRHVIDFITKHRDQPFYLYYPLSHVHGEILPTPDSAPASGDHYADNVAYMDKLVGKLLAELDRLALREKTLIVFMGDNGTANGRADRGRSAAGPSRAQGFDARRRRPGAVDRQLASVTPAGKISEQLIDATTCSDLRRAGGAKLPEKPSSMAAASPPSSRRNRPAPPVGLQSTREQWYVREAGWKLNQAGELFDMSDAPFTEKLVTSDSIDPAANAARKRLQATLDQLTPRAASRMMAMAPAGTPAGSKNGRQRRKGNRPGRPSSEAGGRFHRHGNSHSGGRRRRRDRRLARAWVGRGRLRRRTRRRR